MSIAVSSCAKVTQNHCHFAIRLSEKKSVRFTKKCAPHSGCVPKIIANNKMEYSILGLNENANLEEAKRAIKTIRVEYHPDKNMNAAESEKTKSRHFLNLANEAYERIKKKIKVNSSLQHFNRHSRFSAFDLFDTDMQQVFNNINEVQVVESMPTMVHTSSYRYQNTNGAIQESGTVNGKNMTENELAKNRLTGSFFSSRQKMFQNSEKN